MPIPATAEAPARLVVLVSGSGTNLQALLDAADDRLPNVDIVAVGADRDDIEGLRRAQRHAIPTFIVKLQDFDDRDQWDGALSQAIADFSPDLIVSAGFMKLFGPQVLESFPIVNTHPALLPSFPGAHAVRDALAYGVTITGCSVHFVDAGVDTGPVIAQQAVAIEPSDDEATLHERIKTIERDLLVDVVGRLCRSGWSIESRKVTIS